MSDRPQMLRLYLSSERTGDGYRTAFVIARRGETATLLVPSLIVSITIPAADLAKARPIAYRPRVVRDNLLKRIRLYRRHGLLSDNHLGRSATTILAGGEGLIRSRA